MGKIALVVNVVLALVLFYMMSVMVCDITDLKEDNDALMKRGQVTQAQINYMYEMINELVELTDSQYQSVEDEHGRVRASITNNPQARRKGGRPSK